ncbi:MAG: endonuclease [Acidimicrobiaceae bacterium]|nr:endonuclease [Acidimicrobiaceae bacterium]MYE97131.1 endonuclease [Acidimicrobiaceae bacterium]MYI53157.1 endonuclease [Acidimicrobiaceae bacterium]
MPTTSLAQQIIEWIFAQRHTPGDDQVTFTRDDLISAADALQAPRPKNLGDIVYSLRYRVPLPDSIRRTAPPGHEWAIFPGGNAVYTMRTVPFNLIEPRQGLRTIRLPDATPGVISKYSLTDEQALLARVRYNRLLDVFTGLACYPLQSHLRTSITITNAIDGTPSSSQVETDDVYVGLDEHGAHYILPVQAKGGSDSLSVIQIWQDLRVAEQKFPDLIARPVAAQFMEQSVIALFEFQESNDEITIAREHHYSLVAPEELESHELAAYRTAAQHATR